MPAPKKASALMCDDMVELSTENEAFKKLKVDYDEKWLQESKAKRLKEIDDEKRAYLYLE